MNLDRNPAHGKDAIAYGHEGIPYAELLAAPERAAWVLRDRGVRPSDRVAVMTYNSPDSANSARHTHNRPQFSIRRRPITPAMIVPMQRKRNGVT